MTLSFLKSPDVDHQKLCPEPFHLSGCEAGLALRPVVPPKNLERALFIALAHRRKARAFACDVAARTEGPILLKYREVVAAREDMPLRLRLWLGPELAGGSPAMDRDAHMHSRHQRTSSPHWRDRVANADELAAYFADTLWAPLFDNSTTHTPLCGGVGEAACNCSSDKFLGS